MRGDYRHSNRHTPRERSAMCVQRFDDSRNSAIRITYRISLRSSSLQEPRYPLLKVVFQLIYLSVVMSINHYNIYKISIDKSICNFIGVI
jgi:hypothetical protein